MSKRPNPELVANNIIQLDPVDYGSTVAYKTKAPRPRRKKAV